MKSELSTRAKDDNKRRKLSQVARQCVATSPVVKETGLLAVLNLALGDTSSGGSSAGCLWGISDNHWPLAETALVEASRQHKFVATHADKWCQEFGQRLSVGPDGPGHGYKQSSVAASKFCQKLGGCYHTLGQLEKQHITQWLDFFRNCARAFRQQPKNSHPLLVLSSPAPAGSRSSSSNAPPPPQASQVFNTYLLCEVSLKPLDFCLWQCAVQLHDSGSDAGQRLVADLDFYVQDNGWRRPKLTTMHQQSYIFRKVGPAEKLAKLIWDYKIESLRSVSVGSLGPLQNTSGMFEFVSTDERDPDVSIAVGLVALLKDKPIRQKQKPNQQAQIREPRAGGKRTPAETEPAETKPAALAMVLDDGEDDEGQQMDENDENNEDDVFDPNHWGHADIEELAEEPVAPTEEIFWNWKHALDSQDPCNPDDNSDTNYHQNELDDGLTYEDANGRVYDSMTDEYLGTLPLLNKHVGLCFVCLCDSVSVCVCEVFVCMRPLISPS